MSKNRLRWRTSPAGLRSRARTANCGLPPICTGYRAMCCCVAEPLPRLRSATNVQSNRPGRWARKCLNGEQPIACEKCEWRKTCAGTPPNGKPGPLRAVSERLPWQADIDPGCFDFQSPGAKRRQHDFEDNFRNTERSAAGIRQPSPGRARRDRHSSANGRIWRRSRAELPLGSGTGRHQVPARGAARTASGAGPATTFVPASHGLQRGSRA